MSQADQESSHPKIHTMRSGDRFVVGREGDKVVFRPHFTNNSIPKDAIIRWDYGTEVRFAAGPRMNYVASFDETGFLFETGVLVPYHDLINDEVLYVL